MARFTIEKYMDAPPGVVFDTALDLRSLAKTIRGIEELEVLTGDPIGPGTRFRETRVLFGKRATEVMEITVFERPSRWVFEAESHGTKYVTSHELVPEGSGTKLLLTFSGEPRTFLARVMGVVFSFLMKACMREVEKDLDDLKAVVEGRASEKVAARRGTA